MTVQEMGSATQDHANRAGDMTGQKWEEGKQGAAETKDQGGNMLQQVLHDLLHLVYIININTLVDLTCHRCLLI